MPISEITHTSAGPNTLNISESISTNAPLKNTNPHTFIGEGGVRVSALVWESGGGGGGLYCVGPRNQTRVLATNTFAL